MSNLIQFPGSRTEQPETTVERDWERRERLACRDRKAVQSDIDGHIAARRAYGQALARVTAIEDGNLPTAQIEEANLRAFEAYEVMTEAARRLLVVMPTDLKALVDLLLYLEKNFSVLPPEIACGVSNGQSLAFDLLRTVRLSLREIAKYGKQGPTS
jgi:hypothetical protein